MTKLWISHNKRYLTLLTGCIFLLTICTLGWANIEQAISERTKPVGSVCIKGNPCASAIKATNNNANTTRTVESIYQSGCASCHLTGAGNAPIMGNQQQWNLRVKRGIDSLYKSALDGRNAMPAKGLCFDCSDNEIKSVVDYMIEQLK